MKLKIVKNDGDCALAVSAESFDPEQDTMFHREFLDPSMSRESFLAEYPVGRELYFEPVTQS